MNQFFGKLKKTAIILIVLLMIVLIFILAVKFSFNTQYYEKSTFTQEELNIISSVISVDCNNIDIKKITFSHAKDSLFVMYISEIQQSDLDINYVKINDNFDEALYESMDNQNIECILDNNQNTAVIRIKEFNDVLYNMVKWI